MRVLSVSRKLLSPQVAWHNGWTPSYWLFCLLCQLLHFRGTALVNPWHLSKQHYLLPETFLLSISPPKKGNVWKEIGRKCSFLTFTWRSCLHCLLCQIKCLLGYTGMRVSYEKSEWPWYLISCCTAGRDTDQSFMKGYFVLNVWVSWYLMTASQ